MRDSTEERFAELQSRLRRANWPAGDGRQSRLMMIVPSINLDVSVMTRHAADVAVLEERPLWWLLALRQPWVDAIAVTRRPVLPEAIDYYLSLLPDPAHARRRMTFVSLDDDSTRPLAEVILDRPDVIETLRAAVVQAPDAFIVGWNFAEPERDLALALDAPIYGVDHRFAPREAKSAGRRLFREVGVPCSPGVEGLRTADEISAAIATLNPAGDVVVKLDFSVYGEGNQRLAPGADPHALPADYLADLARQGGAVEEWIDADEVASPSVQLRLLPGGEPLVISTHDQILGGDNGQAFVGCRFPADAQYSALIIEHARRIGDRLARDGVVGRFGVDFVVSRNAGEPWRAHAVELNLRDGGTSHPYGTLWFLTEGNFDADAGVFRLADGSTRSYVASDAVPVGLPSAAAFLEAVDAAGLGWDPATSTGSAFHMFAAIEAFGRIAAVTVGVSHADAAQRHERLLAAVAGD